jgi:hypothetical protein
MQVTLIVKHLSTAELEALGETVALDLFVISGNIDKSSKEGGEAAGSAADDDDDDDDMVIVSDEHPSSSTSSSAEAVAEVELSHPAAVKKRRAGDMEASDASSEGPLKRSAVESTGNYT